MRTLACTALAAAVLAWSPAANATTNLISNGGFETGDFTSWNLSGNDYFTSVESTFEGVAPAAGEFQAVMGSPHGGDEIDQSFTTVFGATYRIQFDLANEGSGPNYFTVSFDHAFEVVCVSCDAFPYRHYTWDVTSIFPSGGNSLEFDEINQDFWFHLDNVSVTRLPAGVPEPTAWALMTAGLAGAGVALRRRRASLGAAQA